MNNLSPFSYMKKEGKEGVIRQTKLVFPDQPYHDDFIETLTRIFNVSRWFGIMDPGSRLWKAWSLLLFLILIVIEGAAVWRVIKALAGWAMNTEGNRSVTARLSGTMFYSSALASLVLSSKLFFHWQSIIEFWVSIERAIHINLSKDLTLKKRMIKVVIIIIVCSVFEHLMSAVSVVEFDCPQHLILKRYIMRSYAFLFLEQDYSVWIAIPLLFMSNVATALWNFQDMLIILISMGLTSRYLRLNQFVAKISEAQNKDDKVNVKTKAVTVYFWRKIREAYVKQAALVRKVDGYIGALILLSSFGNFYFICLQLFLGITQGVNGTTALKMAYYLVSLAWLTIRFTWMVLAASDVNAQSKLALHHLHSCSSTSYNVELAASVVTYQLVLIQFDDKGSSDH